MKTLQSGLLLLALLCTILSTQSCKNECDDLLCQNGGICVDGSCDCPEGFSGTNCQIRDLCFGITCENGSICIDGTCDCPDGYIGVSCESFDPNQIQTLLNNGKSPIDLYNGGIGLDQLYGYFYEGGLLFYLNINDGTGLVAATENQNEIAQWGCEGADIIGLANSIALPTNPDTEVGARIGDGASNTTAIIAECGDVGIAAQLCRNLGEDWFLPSRGELNLMYTNLRLKGHGGFPTSRGYWSSSEFDANLVWGQNFASGLQVLGQKNGPEHVRAARAF